MIGIRDRTLQEVGFDILDILKALMAGIFTSGSGGDGWEGIRVSQCLHFKSPVSEAQFFSYRIAGVLTYF